RAWHDALHPLASAIYRERPGAHATARLKACLQILGRLDDPRVRPPVPPLGAAEYGRLAAALDHAARAARALETAAEEVA
ncbi:MAG: hypothetical protein JO048_04585, partial [Methylobacteriaceae bacterium]|nr:hypothetical protein [Methylobacteriaceae bacterium]